MKFLIFVIIFFYFLYFIFILLWKIPLILKTEMWTGCSSYRVVCILKYNKNQLLLNTFIGYKPNAFRPTCWPSSVVKNTNTSIYGIKELGHLLTRPGLTQPEVSLMVFLDFFCLLGCSFFINLGNLLRDIRFTCIHFSCRPVFCPKSLTVSCQNGCVDAIFKFTLFIDSPSY
jgi:hypothetical protein